MWRHLRSNREFRQGKERSKAHTGTCLFPGGGVQEAQWSESNISILHTHLFGPEVTNFNWNCSFFLFSRSMILTQQNHSSTCSKVGYLCSNVAVTSFWTIKVCLYIHIQVATKSSDYYNAYKKYSPLFFLILLCSCLMLNLL